ncbi:MAG: MBOAT family protein [Oscillospiraceae bacterium]|nr:MBOAT family protein [Oscillospiraceae bacterium]
MVFSSILFMFFYLPVVLIIYYLLGRRYRNLFLLIASLAFYGWGEPIFILLMVFNIIIDFIFGLLIQKNSNNKKRAKVYLIIILCVNILLLCFFKYAGFLVGIVKLIPAFSFISVPKIPLPLGISFYTFQALSYCVDVYKQEVPAEKSLINFGSYKTLFPQLIAGPIIRYVDVAEQFKNRILSMPKVAKGIRLFIIGLSKKVLIANQMGLLWESLKVSPNENGILASWIGIIAFSLQIYFDFSGYSDMACGLGNMLGFEFLKNFNYPYISKSITDFWRRWHISLSSWFRDYVYIPLGGNRKGLLRQFLNIFIVWFLTGLWHGASWNYVCWGLYFFFILSLEKLFLLKLLNKLPNFIKHFYAVFLILIGWVIFSFENFHDMTGYLSSMFNFSNGLMSNYSFSTIIGFIPLIIIGIFASLPIAKNVYLKYKDNGVLSRGELPVFLALLIFCTASMVSQSYSPFLYFRF